MNQIVRQPAVAGRFYPAEATVLKTMLHELFSHSDSAQPDTPIKAPLKAIIAPHAGYIYSGPIAANAYRCLYQLHDHYHRVILLGPSHRVALDNMALSSADTYMTPLGPIPIDIETVQSLRQLKFVELNDSAHLLEHSLEVHLPFLQSTLDSFRLIPIVVGDINPAYVAQLLDLFVNDEHTLIVVSTDLSHFHDYATATKLDRQTSNHILNYQYDAIGYEDACGRNPMNGVLYWARQHHFRIRLLDLRNSGDTAGDKSRVVGYAAYHIYDHAD